MEKRNKNGTVKKGVVLNPTGRPKGSLNRTTVELKEAIKKVVDSELSNTKKYLSQLEPKERLDFFVKIITDILPKQNQIEHTAIIQEKQPKIVMSTLSIESSKVIEDT